ncbi:MAG: CCA tRNA nucleotidyltransferase, partial [Candidatus Marinimicrobia bacterium]|nr:CCA tRNA nucleotidyltransferase [Candidatus Neomarinimicrobiota bacterium]
LEKTIKNIGKIAEDNKIAVYIVGGVVRDALLNRPITDLDIVVIGDGIKFAELVAKHFKIKTIIKYGKFGTAMIPMKNLTLELTSARKEVYKTNSRKPEITFTDLNEDLKRRDFTINSMAVDIRPSFFGDFFDPFNGIQDLKQKIIRTPLDAESTFFDDPLRMLRAIRFSTQLNYEIDKTTFNGIINTADRINIISYERIRDELFKILSTAKPSIGLKLMDESELMDILFPELSALKGVEKKNGYFHKDVWKHTIEVVDNITKYTDNPILRLIALFHDVGKPNTKRYKSNIGWTYYAHEDVGAKMFEKIGKRLKLSTKEINYITKLIKLHLRPIAIASEKVTDSAVRRLMVDAGDDINDLLSLCRADITSKNEYKVKSFIDNFNFVEQRIIEVEERDKLRNFQSPVSGKEIMEIFNIKPGPIVGKIKSMIESNILDGKIKNDYDATKSFILNNKEYIIKNIL